MEIQSQLIVMLKYQNLN